MYRRPRLRTGRTVCTSIARRMAAQTTAGRQGFTPAGRGLAHCGPEVNPACGHV